MKLFHDIGCKYQNGRPFTWLSEKRLVGFFGCYSRSTSRAKQLLRNDLTLEDAKTLLLNLWQVYPLLRNLWTSYLIRLLLLVIGAKLEPLAFLQEFNSVLPHTYLKTLQPKAQRMLGSRPAIDKTHSIVFWKQIETTSLVPLFHQGCSRACSEPVPNLESVCVSTGKELALVEKNWFPTSTNPLLVWNQELLRSGTGLLWPTRAAQALWPPFKNRTWLVSSLTHPKNNTTEKIYIYSPPLFLYLALALQGISRSNTSRVGEQQGSWLGKRRGVTTWLSRMWKTKPVLKGFVSWSSSELEFAQNQHLVCTDGKMYSNQFFWFTPQCHCDCDLTSLKNRTPWQTYHGSIQTDSTLLRESPQSCYWRFSWLRSLGKRLTFHRQRCSRAQVL